MSVLFVVADICMKSEARGPVERWHCFDESQCEYFYPGSGCKCIYYLCHCPKAHFHGHVGVEAHPNSV